MSFDEWLDAERGRLKACAEHFRVSMSAVCQWRTNGVPPAHMKAVRDLSRGEVSLDEMLEQKTAKAA